MAATSSYRKALQDIRPERNNVPLWANPEVLYWYDEWALIRDAASGEKDIKEAGQVYLTQLDGMDSREYAAYLDRASYYNFTGRTISALVGTLFKKTPKIEGLPERFKDLMGVIAQSGSDLATFAQHTASEVFTLGRFGVLVDLPEEASTQPQPYFTGYVAENILDWKWAVDRKTGRMTLTKVVLREYNLVNLATAQGSTTQTSVASYRVLRMEDGAYHQDVYAAEGRDANIDTDQPKRVTPLRQGKAIPYIPFLFFGVSKNEPGVEKSPMLDIARLNISHFKSYAHLEHGRFFTGLPIYYAEGDGTDESNEYVIGPSVVWNVQNGSKPGILEFNGHGLKFLENALIQKESHAASLGGRMVGISAQSTAETDNQTALKERNEQSLLLNMSRVLDMGFTTLCRWAVWMAGLSVDEAAKVEVEFTKEFLLTGAGSREFRAIHSMYKDGVMPIEVLHDYFQKAEVIPDWMSVAEFTKLLKSQASFPNNPDFLARKAGYPNAQAMVTDEQQTAKLEQEMEISDAELEADEKAQETAAKTAEKTAKAAAKAPAAPVGEMNPGGMKPPAAKKPPTK